MRPAPPPALIVGTPRGDAERAELESVRLFVGTWNLHGSDPDECVGGSDDLDEDAGPIAINGVEAQVLDVARLVAHPHGAACSVWSAGCRRTCVCLRALVPASPATWR